MKIIYVSSSLAAFAVNALEITYHVQKGNNATNPDVKTSYYSNAKRVIIPTIITFLAGLFVIYTQCF